ncbi:MAG TPA: bifunctional salicylyl-CoA 5-hydroxylase/oxidoreductase [Gemmatimonadaceae bacterium]|jgi:anthraniloyl-CoA monooxygenase|nr:bifunctional salicylyl-CoA 5-hydroxylase/oxidoreductase [Gemmatimonadaceae bacterium]
MRIACLGGGPAGLYFSILAKKANPSWDITVVERNRADDTFGWGVVFSDKTMDGFRSIDPETHDAIVRAFRHWDDIDVHFKGRVVTSGGHGFCGIARITLLRILQERAAGLGVDLRFQTEVTDPTPYAREFDFVVASDGANSVTRRTFDGIFRPNIDVRRNRFIWLGSRAKLDAFTFDFRETEWGWFNLHAYRFADDWSTFIVETPEKNWRAAGIDRMPLAESIHLCEALFADRLQGQPLISNAHHKQGADAWLVFQRILCERWYHENIVLIGDAAHTAHFSIGSGTKLAMEDAIALARVLSSGGALAQYQSEREVEALKLQSAARNRMEWFEQIERYVHLEPEQFAYSLLTGSQRIGHENLKVRDKRYVASVERWFGERCGVTDVRPPMFTPFTVRGVSLKNRVLVSPMATYRAIDGMPNDFHLVHFGARAMGGAAMVFTEMTCVSPEGRITPGCLGLWTDAQRDAWARIVQYVHGETDAKIALQLGHSGRKGSTRRGWEGIDQPLESDNWPLVSASAIPYIEGVSDTPREATHADLACIREQFVAAARRGAIAGFDWLELHCAHGYFLSSFISPLTNRRTDEYGGSLANRCRYPLEVFRAMRDVWPEDRPISVRISAHDWVPGGLTPDDAIEVARLFKDAGADVIDCSSGQVSKAERPVYGRMFQVPFADRIRNEVGIPTIAVGNIFEGDHVNTIIAAGRADLCAVARPHLADPAWTLHEAAKQGYADLWWPDPYLNGKQQLERNLARAALLALQA